MTRTCNKCRFLHTTPTGQKMCYRPIKNDGYYMVIGAETVPLIRSAYSERESTLSTDCGPDAKFFMPLPSLVEWIRVKLTSFIK